MVSSATQPLLRVENLSVTYNPGDWNERTVINGLDLTLPPGDFALLSGANGSGKSSLLRALCGDLPQARVQGQATLRGRSLLDASPRWLAHQIAVIDQDPTQGSCEHLLVSEQLRLAGDALAKRILARLKTFGSSVEPEQQVRSLSGGQRQLLAVLIAVERRTPLLLADEPTAALDPHFAALVLDLLAERSADSALATLMISHQGQLPDRSADGIRHLRLDNGRLLRTNADANQDVPS